MMANNIATENTAAEREERLKSALWYALGQFIDDTCLSVSLNATPQFIGAFTELVYTQIANTARDTELFAHHASRSIITPADAMLLARRNDALESMMRRELEKIQSAEGRPSGAEGARARPASDGEAGRGEGRKRGRPAGSGRGRGRGRGRGKV